MNKPDARHGCTLAVAADVAYECDAPLTSIRGAAKLPSKDAADALQARWRFLGNNAGRRAARLLGSRLLELSHIDASEKAFQHAFASVLRVSRGFAEKGA